MTTSLSKANSSALIEIPGFTRERIDLIKRTVAKDATDDELQMFLNQANKMGLDPLTKQIYFQKYKNRKTGEWKVTIIVGIDGYRVTAARTGLYAGSDDAVFDDPKNPTIATVTIYKMVGGQRCPFTASARWNEYCPQPPQDHMWRKMPNTMLAKCAEGLALRKAFPAELGGAYIKEEMDQAGEPKIIDAPTVIEEPKVIATTKLSKLLEAFEALGVDQTELEATIAKPLTAATELDLEILRGYYYQQKAKAEAK